MCAEHLVRTSKKMTFEEQVTELEIAVLVGYSGNIRVGRSTLQVEGIQDPEPGGLLSRVSGPNGYGAIFALVDRGYSCHNSREGVWGVSRQRNPITSEQLWHYIMSRRDERSHP
ncbi:hypothetical protein KY361_05045 [Candidatus Woesearchaeota archaeon]|nr:hypothetical protein [Candidatus Woesearchaeota archaeon]